MITSWKFAFRDSTEFQFGQETLRVLIIRPGETLYDKERCIQGNLNVRLTEEGRREARRLATDLCDEDLQRIYYAPARSAEETARIVSETLDVPRKALDGLRNQNQGSWQGMRVGDLQRRQPKVFRRWGMAPESIFPPGGEDFRDVQRRVRSALQWVLRRHRDGTVGLVVCEPMAAFVTCQLKSEEAKNLWDYIGLHGLWEPVVVGNHAFMAR